MQKERGVVQIAQTDQARKTYRNILTTSKYQKTNLSPTSGALKNFKNLLTLINRK